MVVISFSDLDRKAKHAYKSNNPKYLEVAYKFKRQIGSNSAIHLIGTTCTKTGNVINNLVASHRFNGFFGQPFTASIKCSNQDMEIWAGLALASASVKVKNFFPVSSNLYAHFNSGASIGTNGTKFNGASVIQLFNDESHSTSWCLGGQFSFRSEWKTIFSLSYLSPKLNVITRAYLHIFHQEITSTISYKFTDRVKSGLSVTMVENNMPLIGVGVKYKCNDKITLTAKLNDIGRVAVGIEFSYGPNAFFSFSNTFD